MAPDLGDQLMPLLPMATTGNAGLPAGFRKKTPNGDARMGAGILFVTPDGKGLFTKRAPGEGRDHVGEWAFPGGGVEEDEEPADAARREAAEEIGHIAKWELAPLHRETRDHMDFTSFGQPVGEEFVPALNEEHDDYQWADLADPPSPLHPGVAALLAKFFAEEAREPEHQADDARPAAEHTVTIEYDGDFDMGSLLRAMHYLGAIGASRTVEVAGDDSQIQGEMDEKGIRTKFGWDGDGADKIRSAKLDGVDILAKSNRDAHDSTVILAMDEESMRSIDQDGHLHIAETNVCKACVSPYKGSEIPDYERLGLDPDETYQMLRPPEELAKAFPTINGKPLLRKHIATSADDHQTDEVIGAVGTTARWEPPYIKNGLTIWPSKDIHGIDTGTKYQLSPGYHYVPLMEPGVFNGEAYDGQMIDISFNHLALVEEGRQGPDVVVADSAIETAWGVFERALADIGIT
jgi:8-oxo-dGTP pyrophosphatase MutT (NUDIX family)